MMLLKNLLAQGNAVPETVYEVKQIIYPLGLEVDKIHACKNDYILYRGPKYEDLEKCPICGLDRFNHRKDGGDDESCNRNRRKGGPKKVFLVLSYHSSFEVLVCKQGVRIVTMAQREA
jgi:hypothetical protein